MRLRIPSWPNLFRYLQHDLRFRLPLKSKHIIQKWLADMGTGITDVIGEPHDFLPPRSDEFQKLWDWVFDHRSGQTKDYEIGISCFSAKHAALRRKSKDWLARNLLSE